MNNTHSAREGIHSIFIQSFHLFPVIIPCFWWQIYRPKYPTRTFKCHRFTTASRAQRCVTKMQLQRPWKGIAEGLCTSKWDTKTREESCHLQLVWARRQRWQGHAKPPGTIGNSSATTERARACTQTMTTQRFLQDLCCVGQMQHYNCNCELTVAAQRLLCHILFMLREQEIREHKTQILWISCAHVAISMYNKSLQQKLGFRLCIYINIHKYVYLLKLQWLLTRTETTEWQWITTTTDNNGQSHS